MSTSAVVLPPIVDREASAALVAPLRAAVAAGGVTIDAASVSRIGQSGLQLLVSAARTAAAADVPFAIATPSDALLRAAALAGLDRALMLDRAEAAAA